MSTRWLGLAGMVAGLLLGPAFADDGRPPPDSVTWILVGGPHIVLGPHATRFAGRQLGLQIHAPGVSPEVTTSDINPTTGAAGEIVAGPLGKECPVRYHYHGALFGLEDSGERCGWGEAVPFDQATWALGFLSEAVTRKARALKKFRNGDSAGAVRELADANAALRGLERDAHGKLPGAQAKVLARAINRAIELDDHTAAAVQRDLPIRAKRLVDRAAAHERKILRLLRDANLLLVG